MAKRYKRTQQDIQRLKNRTKDELYKETLKTIREVNQRLEKLERPVYTEKRVRVKGRYVKRQQKLKFTKGTWATSKLSGRIGKNYNKKDNRVKINKNMTKTELIKVRKASLQFLESGTSTSSGIREVQDNIKKGIKREIGVTDKQAEKLYEMIYDKDFKDLSRKIPPSDLWALSADTIDGNFSKEQFIDQIKNYAESGNDLDIKEVAGAIYDKFISG